MTEFVEVHRGLREIHYVLKKIFFNLELDSTEPLDPELVAEGLIEVKKSGIALLF